jgi:hypothetical protein
MKVIVTKEQNDKLNHKIKSMVEKHGVGETLKIFDDNVNIIKRVYKYKPLSFLEQFNDLTPIKKDGIIYYVDKDRMPLFYYTKNRKNGKVFIDYYRIWLYFSYILGLNPDKVQAIMSKWLEETYNIKGLTPIDLAGFNMEKLD